MKLKLFTGYADEVEREFNSFLVANPNIKILDKLVMDNRLYIFYTE